MKLFISLFTAVFLLGISMEETQGKVCLSVDRQTITIKDLVNIEKASLSQDGRYLLYEKKQGEDTEDKNTVLVFMDLKTQKKEDFLSGLVVKMDIGGDRNYIYEFSPDNMSLFGVVRGDRNIKLWSLPHLEKKVIPITEGRDAMSVGFLEDGRIAILELEKGAIELILPIWRELNQIAGDEVKEFATAHIFEYYRQLNSLNYFFIRVVDPSTLNQSETVFQNYFSLPCMHMDKSSNRLLRVHEDGSLTRTSFTENKELEEIFGPVKGFTMGSHHLTTMRQCHFLSDSLNILRVPEKDGYIVRDLTEGKEFFLSPDFLTVWNGQQFMRYELPSLSLMDALIKYPFALSIASDKVYHIPTGRTTAMNDIRKMHLALKGQVSLEHQEKNGNAFLQAVSYPFNPYQRKVIFKIDRREVCNAEIDREKGLVNIMSFGGDLFSIDVPSGVVRRRLGFFGQCFLKEPVISGSGVVFLGINGEGNPVVHRLHEQCIEESESVSSQTIEERLIYLSQDKDPSQSPHLSALISLLEKGKNIQNYTQFLGSVFWNILLHSPTLYLELHRRYPKVGGMLPVRDTYPDLGPDSSARLMASVQSILKITTSTIHYTQLSDWDFLRLLQPLLQELSKSDRELYMERIAVSISNGAAKAIPLLQDVFQSKIYYVVKGHVKELFGFERQPVSDVSVIRTQEGGLITVILSSNLIEGYPDVSTDFGLHYAVVEEISHKTLKNKKGLAFDKVVEWNLSNGKSYRAKIDVHVKHSSALNKFQSPDYKSIWKDHKMVGVVVVGSSLRDFAGKLTKQYLSYFHDQGFQFSSTEDTNLKTFLLERIQNCEVDYFLKESHSDGDERNVFRFSRGNHIIRGIRYGEQGRIEVVYIIFPRKLNPEEDSLGTDLLSNRELSQAIAKREDRGCGQITYFNTSCWSHVKARYEIEAVNSFLFLNIPSVNLSDTFANTKDNIIRILLDSYRKDFNFDQFRKALAANKGYASGNRNHYIFPDESGYAQTIFHRIISPLDIQIQLERKEGEAWKTIDPDEAL